MADPKDNGGAEGPRTPGARSGAVKPPVLEGTARPLGSKDDKEMSAEAGKPASDTSKPDAKTQPLPPPKPDPNPTSSAAKAAAAGQSEGAAGGAWLAGLVGGLAGLGAAYALALLGYWPAAPAAPQPEDPRIATLSRSVPELETVTSTLQSELATLTAHVADLPTETDAPAQDTAASEQLASEIAALSARVDALAVPPQDQADPNADNTAAIANLEAELAALREATTQSQAELGSVASQIAALEADVSAGTAAEAGQVRLPLVVSGFETAFATGTAYDAELAALRQALPDLSVPQPVLANAMTGLKRPDLVARDFNAVLPDILAGRPVNADAGWQDAATDWFRGIIAIRPTEAVEGDSPEAVVARLEGAISRADFIAAKAELDALPAPMRAAAGPVAAEIENQAAAQGFLVSLRQAVLTGGSGA